MPQYKSPSPEWWRTHTICVIVISTMIASIIVPKINTRLFGKPYPSASDWWQVIAETNSDQIRDENGDRRP